MSNSTNLYQVSLLQVTIERLEWMGKKPQEVLWVGNFDGNLSLTWEQFAEFTDVSYNWREGGPHVAIDLVIVGNGWYLERMWNYDYDDTDDSQGPWIGEWWAPGKWPQRMEGARPFYKVIGSEPNMNLMQINGYE